MDRDLNWHQLGQHVWSHPPALEDARRPSSFFLYRRSRVSVTPYMLRLCYSQHGRGEKTAVAVAGGRTVLRGCFGLWLIKMAAERPARFLQIRTVYVQPSRDWRLAPAALCMRVRTGDLEDRHLFLSLPLLLQWWRRSVREHDAVPDVKRRHDERMRESLRSRSGGC